MITRNSKSAPISGLPTGVTVTKVMLRGKPRFLVRLGRKFVGSSGKVGRRYFKQLSDARKWIFDDGAMSAAPGPVVTQKELGTEAVRDYKEYRAGVQALRRAKEMNMTIEEIFELAQKYRTPERGEIGIDDAVTQMLAAKKLRGARPDTLRGLTSYCRRFAKLIGEKRGVHTITREVVAAHLEQIGGSDTNMDNIKRAISSLLTWCAKGKWIVVNPLLKWDWRADLGLHQMAATEKDSPRIFTLAEARSVLKQAIDGCGPGQIPNAKGKTSTYVCAPGEMVPYYALCMFGGVRPDGEFMRLDWEDIDFGDEPHIEIKKKKVKTGTRRVIPMEANLIEWLLPYRQFSGRIAPIAFPRKQLLFSRCSVFKGKWPQDIMRHSFASYRIKAGQPPSDVALAMGHKGKTETLFRFYFDAVKSKFDALAYVALSPGDFVKS